MPLHLAITWVESLFKLAMPRHDELAVSAREVEALERSLGPGSPALLPALGRLVTEGIAREDLSTAVEALSRARAIIEATPVAELEAFAGPGVAEGVLTSGVDLAARSGSNDPSVAVALIARAELLTRQKREVAAEADLSLALVIQQHAFGAEDPRLTVALGQLAECLELQKRDGEALPVWRRALSIVERAHGADHPALAPALRGVARTGQAIGALDESKAALQRAKAVTSKP